jgi:hypothetical protein
VDISQIASGTRIPSGQLTAANVGVRLDAQEPVD